MTKTTFTSFDRAESGRVVTSYGNYEVVYSRNPYGSHNFCLVDRDNGEAFRHGNTAVLYFLLSWGMDKAYRRARRFLADRGRCLDLVFYEEAADV